MSSRTTRASICIRQEQVAAFGRLSFDCNPLHVDPVYSRATQLGRPVVYGMCAVLLALARWADGRSFQITGIQGKFGKPLFENEQYDLEIVETSTKVKVNYLKGATVQSGFVFTWADFTPENPNAAQAQASFHPRLAAKVPALPAALESWKNQPVAYSIHLKFAPELLALLGLHLGQMPFHQLNALLGSSYFIGMELPGQQALYAGFEFQFEPAPAGQFTEPFEFRNLAPGLDERLNRFSITGSGTGIRSFSWIAFQRPKRVCYEPEQTRAAVGESDLFKDKVVFVSGATRGFGSVLAQMFALQGANTILNYRANREAADALARSLTLLGLKATCLAGDVSKRNDCQQMRDAIKQRYQRVDILIANAFPQIVPRAFLDQQPEEFLEFLRTSVSTCVTLFHELLPLIPKGGIVINISTIYTRSPASHFAHYVAAKSALEGLMRTLALEFCDLQFLIVRPPRMLTDQTNLTFDLTPAVSAVAVGHRLLEAIQNTDRSRNLAELDLT